MPGEKGLLNLLIHQGFTVERVVGENHFKPEAALVALRDKEVVLDYDTYSLLMDPEALITYGFDTQKNLCCKRPPKVLGVNITADGKVKMVRRP